jgi:hypothetical protein
MRVAIILGALALVLAAQAPRAEAQERTTLQPERLPGMCLTMGGTHGSISMPCDGTDRQFFVLPGEAGGPLIQGDRCLAVRGDDNYPQLLPETCDGSPAQTWTMNEEGELRSATARCLSVIGASSRSGTMVYGAQCPEEGRAHQWRAKYVHFTNVVEASLESKARPGMCIGYDTRVDLYPCSDAYRQVMSFDAKAVTQLRMMSSCFSGGYAFGALGLAECHDTLGQTWLVLESGAVANMLVQCIEVVNEDGRDVLRTLPCRGKPEQQWIVRKPPAVQ